MMTVGETVWGNSIKIDILGKHNRIRHFWISCVFGVLFLFFCVVFLDILFAFFGFVFGVFRITRN